MIEDEKAAVARQNRIVVFQEKTIRRAWHNDEWWFSVIDVVGVLSESSNPKRYWSDLKRKLSQEAGSGQPYEKIVRLKLPAPDGRQRDTDCADIETLFRIIQSIPSPNAEPFKRWLAKVGHDRVKEIEDPELAGLRARELYEAKGYPRPWIEKRLRAISIRGELTREWKERGVEEGSEYAILTAEIAKATFGMTPTAHYKFKGLNKIKGSKNNLRDHMTDLELIFTMLGEASTTEIARKKDVQGFTENKHAAKEGGAVAGNARKDLEAKTGTPVVSRENYLNSASSRFIENPTPSLIDQPTEEPAADAERLRKDPEKSQKKLQRAVTKSGRDALPTPARNHKKRDNKKGNGEKR